MNTFFIKQNDTSPALEATLKDADGVAVNVAGATIRFHMKAADGTVKTDAAATIVDGPAGEVKYAWAAADTDTVGTYYAEFEVTYADTTIETFPNNTYIPIVITDDIA